MKRNSLVRKVGLFVSAATCAMLAVSCATVHSAFMTNVSSSPQHGRMIEASASKFVFLAFNFDNDYAFGARDRLMAACPNGMVTGILTTFESKWYVFFTDFEVKDRGLCVQNKQADAAVFEGGLERVAYAKDGAR